MMNKHKHKREDAKSMLLHHEKPDLNFTTTPINNVTRPPPPNKNQPPKREDNGPTAAKMDSTKPGRVAATPRLPSR